MTSKTIKTYLISGNSNVIRTVLLQIKYVMRLVVLSEDIEKIKTRDEAIRHSLYFLISQDNERNIYIGESESFYDRLKNYSTEKDFCDIAILFSS